MYWQNLQDVIYKGRPGMVCGKIAGLHPQILEFLRVEHNRSYTRRRKFPSTKRHLATKFTHIQQFL